MGRPERQIDPAAGPVAAFASELRKLRDESGRPSYRELARRANFSAAVLAEAAGGRSFPTLAVVQAYAQACGADAGEWEERWRRVADERLQQRAGAPYRGLASYEVEHASLFFGREALTSDLLRRLAVTRFLAVFGPSGVGKSSLLRAGLVAAVNHGELDAAPDWVTVIGTPGQAPLDELAARVAAAAAAGTASADTASAETAPVTVREVLPTESPDLPTAIAQVVAGRPPGAELLLVVDQFEELFTVCQDREQRDRFVRALLAAVSGKNSRARVVLGVRADFYGHFVAWPELVTAIGDAQVLVGPMGHDQLRDVIVKPAGQAGMTVEGALTSTALAETGNEPGALALVSHALLETWRRSPPGRLTLAAYTEAGGVAHAIAETAERVFAECGPSQRPMFRHILLRLVTVGDDDHVIKRRVPLDELAGGDDPAATAALVERLAQARLLTIDDDSVELAHVALIRFWPRLAEWLAEGRDSLRVQRRVAAAAAEWAELGRDPGALYRGALLTVAQAWAGGDASLTGMTRIEREFLGASDAAEAAGRAAATLVTRRLRRLAAGLAVLLIAVSVAGGIAVWQRQTALSDASAAVSGQLAAQSALLAPVNPDAATLAALAAWRARPTEAARSALLSTGACCTSTQARLTGESDTVSTVALSPDGRLVAAGGRGQAVHLWNAADGRQLAVLRGFSGSVAAVAFSPDGALLAAGSADGTIRLWSTARPTGLGLLIRSGSPIEDLAFSPDGAVLAVAAADGRIGLWNPATLGLEGVLRDAGGPASSVAFSPQDSLLAIGDSHGVTLWDVADAAHPHVAGRLPGATGAITNLAYSPSGGQLAGDEPHGDVLLWDVHSGTAIRLRHAALRSRGLAFSRDGTILITAGSYYDVQLWNTATGQPVTSDPFAVHRIVAETLAMAYNAATGSLALGGANGAVQVWQGSIPPFTGGVASVAALAVTARPAMIAAVGSDNVLSWWDTDGTLRSRQQASHPVAVAVSPRGSSLAVVGSDGTVSILALPRLTRLRQLQVKGPAAGAAFSPDGSLLATASRARITVWNTASATWNWYKYSSHGFFDAVTFSPDGALVAAVTSQGSVVVWYARTGGLAAKVDPVTGGINAIAFSPDGRLLATAGNDGNITLWDPVNLHRVAVLGGPVGSVRALAFSPDGRLLASGEGNGTILLWDTASRSLAATLTGRDAINALAFTPSGTLISGDSSGRIIAWDLDPDDMIRRDCGVLAHDPGLRQAEPLVPGVSYTKLCPP